jgi:hypothetical protein
MQSKDIRLFVVGFGIGAVIAVFILSFVFLILKTNAQTSSMLRLPVIPIQPSSTQIILPTSTITLTPTTTSIPIITPLPTATLSPTELMIESGEIKILGPLPAEAQIKLYEASLKFIAPTYALSKQMSVLINHERFSDPSTTCGPLSIAILQSAGLLANILDPHDFFLLNPDLAKDREILDRAFPINLYDDTRYKIKINKVDWYAQPLLPGDFLYIYMGTDGNFEHMLVVNRVDSQGRAYSVTNYRTELGFVIKETKLYDPNDPTAGIFAQWTKARKQVLGSTGFAGYEVWRLKG